MQFPLYGNCTRFYLRDIWNVDLREVDVVTVYGLGPMMERLGQKLQTELRHGSIVISNEFTIPGLKHKPCRGDPKIHLYEIPEKE